MQSTPQTPAQIAKEAKSFAQGIKESFQRYEPWNKDFDFQRRNLRTHYLRLLLSHPYSKESKDAENHLWMQTSYNFISDYKRRVSLLDQRIELASKANGQHFGDQKFDEASKSRHEAPHVEYRRVLNHFRQFLSAEEKFWVELLQKYQHQFDLLEALPAFKALDIPTIQDRGGAERIESSRSIFPEMEEPMPTQDSQKESRLAIFTKLLVDLGDILRYKEQYNEAGGRPRAGHEGGPARKPTRGGRRGGFSDSPARPRNYYRALGVYKQARLLSPDDGNASHQLAILASYSRDSFTCLLHYYRALCIRQPYDTASQNITRALKKALDEYKEKKANREDNYEPSNAPQKIERLKDWIVVLHALWNFDQDESAGKASKQARVVVDEFKTLIHDRVLPPDTINEIIVLALGGLWRHRMIRNPTIQKDSRRDKSIEILMTIHILSLYRTLLHLGEKELGEKPEENVQGETSDLAQHITAKFRRTLPALRIASKWLRSNFSYIELSASTPESLSNAIENFWSSYVSFSAALSDTFPLNQLPTLKGPLEEDVDMNGFSPIKRLMFVPSAVTEKGLNPGQSQVHPNEEQLMRISDLLADAHVIAEIDNSPSKFSDGKFVLKSSDENFRDLIPSGITSPPAETLATIMESHPDPPRVILDSDDENTTQTSRTDDDPVRDAFRAALEPIESELDEEEDEIVWNPRASVSPIARPTQPSTTMSPPTMNLPQPGLSISPPKSYAPPTASATTAQDLLINTVLGLSRSTTDLSQFGSTAVQPSLIFGSGSPRAPTTSIWSNQGGDTSLFLTSNLTTQGSPRPLSLSATANIYPRPNIHVRTSSYTQNWSNNNNNNLSSLATPTYESKPLLSLGSPTFGYPSNSINGGGSGSGHLSMGRTISSNNAATSSVYQTVAPIGYPNYSSSPLHQAAHTNTALSGSLALQSNSGNPFNDADYRLPYHNNPRESRMQAPLNAYSARAGVWPNR